MNTWKKLILLATNNDLLSYQDHKSVARIYSGVQGCGKMSQLEIEDYLYPSQIKKINDLWAKNEEKITTKIYEAQKELDKNV